MDLSGPILGLRADLRSLMAELRPERIDEVNAWTNE